MGELVNLNKARKTRDKAEAKARAALNRAVHGRTKADKTVTRMERARAETHLDGARRETSTD